MFSRLATTVVEPRPPDIRDLSFIPSEVASQFVEVFDLQRRARVKSLSAGSGSINIIWHARASLTMSYERSTTSVKL